MPDVRETIIRLDHDGNYGEVWTENRGWITRLKRAGFTEVKRQGRGVWLRGGIGQVWIGKSIKRSGHKPTAASLAGLAKAREARRQKRLAVADAGAAGAGGPLPTGASARERRRHSRSMTGSSHQLAQSLVGSLPS